MSNYSYQYRQTLHKTLLDFATDSANTDTIYTILKEHNEQIVVVKDDISFDVSKLKDKTITCLNKFLML
jgi:glycerol-3-phosphate cytidylyltransferase-like family protein